jgi:hypothetical protein
VGAVSAEIVLWTQEDYDGEPREQYIKAYGELIWLSDNGEKQSLDVVFDAMKKIYEAGKRGDKIDFLSFVAD